MLLFWDDGRDGCSVTTYILASRRADKENVKWKKPLARDSSQSPRGHGNEAKTTTSKPSGYSYFGGAEHRLSWLLGGYQGTHMSRSNQIKRAL